MGFLESFLVALAMAVLKWAAAKAIAEAIKAQEDAELQKKRGELNNANRQKYQDANDRAKKIAAAIDLLNRTSSNP